MDDRFSEFLERSLRTFGDFQIEMRRQAVALALRWAESPIEAYLLVALSNMDFADPPHIDSREGVEFEKLREIRCSGSDESISIHVQALVAEYRVDLLLRVASYHDTRPMFIAVECDGHNFHERTKEQAQRDKARDRAIQALGIVALRFTGSEIFRDADRCAADVMRHINLHRMNLHDRSLDE